MRSFIENDFDKILAQAGALFSILLFIYLFFQTGRPIYLIVSILTFCACLIWLLVRNNVTIEVSILRNKRIYQILNILYIVCFSATIFILFFRQEIYVRPLGYFICISIMAGIVSLEILFKKCHALILLQIILLGISLQLSQVSIFPNVVGIDPWNHQMFTLKIQESGFISGGSYSKLPIFHLLISFFSLLTGFGYKYSSIISVGFLQVIVNILFVFILGKFLFNESVGMLSALLLVLSNHHIYMGFWTIPNTLGCVFILIILYLLIKLRPEKPLRCTSLVIFFMIVLIMTHTVASTGMAISLFMFWLASQIYMWLTKSRINASLSLVVLFSVMMFGWWIYVSGHISTLVRLLEWGFNIDIGFFGKSPQQVLGYLATIPFSEQLFNNIGVFTFFSLSFIGCFFMISKKYGNDRSFVMACIGVTPLFIGFFSLITGFSVIEHRWWYLAQILLAIPCGVAILLLYEKINRKQIKFLFLPSVVLLLSFIMIMSPPANIDNHTFVEHSGIRYAMTGSELQALSSISAVWDGKIGGDAYYNTVMTYTGYNNECIDDLLYYKDVSKYRDCYILIRNEIVGRPFKLYSSPYKLEYDPRKFLANNGFSKSYDCGSVEGLLMINKS